MFEVRLFAPEVLKKGKLPGGFHQESFTHNPLQAWRKKETVAAAVRYPSVVKLVALSMDKAPLEQADDFLAMLACEPREEEAFHVPIHRKPVAKGNVVIFGIASVANVGQQVIAGGEPSAGELEDEIGRARPRL